MTFPMGFSQLFALAALFLGSQVTHSLHTIGGILQHPVVNTAVCKYHRRAPSRAPFWYLKACRSATRRYASKSVGGNPGDCVLIGSSTSLSLPPEASLTFPRVLVIEGQFTGNIGCTASSLQETGVMVREGGELCADVTCVGTVEVYGRLFGRIECETLIIGRSGEVIGDVSAASLTVEPGGTIIGTVECGAARQRSEVDINPNARNRKTSNVQFLSDSLFKRGPGEYNGRHEKRSKSSPHIKRNTPTSTEHFVDRFGTPLAHDSSNDAVESIRRNREFVKETRDILNPPSLTGQIPPRKKETLVDDFGNPLVRGASDDEVDSLRRNRELVKKAREIMDMHKRGKERFNPRTDYSSRRANDNRKGSEDGDSRDPDIPPFLK